MSGEIKKLEKEIDRLWEAVQMLGEQLNNIEFMISEQIEDYMHKVVA